MCAPELVPHQPMRVTSEPVCLFLANGNQDFCFFCFFCWLQLNLQDGQEENEWMPEGQRNVLNIPAAGVLENPCFGYLLLLSNLSIIWLKQQQLYEQHQQCSESLCLIHDTCGPLQSAWISPPALIAGFSFLLMHTLRSNEWWFKYLDPCHSYRRPRWSSWLLPLICL